MSAENSPGGVDRGQILLIVLVALALIASLIMLFTDSAGALKLALLAALWAAIIGFFLVTQYRRRAERSQEELEHREELHRAELDRMTAERRSEEAGKEIELRDKQLARDTEVLEDIKRELAALRAQLEELNGREFGYEPAALRAEARRIQELEARTSAARSSTSRSGFSDLGGLEDMGDEDAGTRTGSFRSQIPGAPSADAIVGRLGQYEPTRPQVNPLTQLISESYHQDRQEETDRGDQVKDPRSVFDTGAFQTVPWGQGGAEEAKPRAAAAAEEKKSAEAVEQAEPAGPVDAKTDGKDDRAGKSGESEPVKKPGKTEKSGAAEKVDRPGKAEQADKSDKTDKTDKTDKKSEAPAQPESADRGTEVTEESGAAEDASAVDENGEPRRGRRRRDEHSEGISVAELLANLKKEN